MLEIVMQLDFSVAECFAYMNLVGDSGTVGVCQ